MSNKITYAQLKELSKSGMLGQPCACLGPQNGNKYCPCNMNILNLLIPEDKILLEQEWDNKQKVREELYKKRQEEKQRAAYAEFNKRQTGKFTW